MKPEGLPRTARLRRRVDFERAYTLGTKAVCVPFALFARRNGTEQPRLGVTATKKIGKSVRRNRARRVVKEAYRHCMRDLPAGFDFVVVVRPPLLQMSPRELEPFLRRAATRAAGAR